MKLVDILARELKTWPEGAVAAVQQNIADGRVSFVDCMDVEFSCGQWDYMDACMRIHDQKDAHQFERASDWKSSVVTRAEWQAAVDALNAPKVVEWGGVGSPEPGCSIEYSIGDGWYPCEVRYVLNRDDCPGIALIAWCEHLGKDQYLSNDRDHKFRPARTAERVAAEEREKAWVEHAERFRLSAGVASALEAKIRGEVSMASFFYGYDAALNRKTKPCGS